MLPHEAHWLGNVLNKIPSETLSPLINLGSSTRIFREKGQPFISELIFNPLEKRGIKVVHVDLEPGDGVDIAGDIFNKNITSIVKAHNPRSVLCANILKHVNNPYQLAKLCIEVVQNNGLIIATVPYSFPLHLAPIDTMYRPTLEELTEIFPGCRIIASEIVSCGTFGQQILMSPKVLFKHMIKMTIPWPTLQHWKATMHRNLWLFKEYRTTCIVLEKSL